MTTATQERTGLRLPGELRECQKALTAALAQPLLAEWPEGAEYRDAPQPEAIGNTLIAAIHDDLVNTEIGFLFRESIKSRGRAIGAKASKVSGKLAHYSNLNFLIEVNWEAWKLLTGMQRVALIDHELMHFSVEDTEDGTKYSLVHHDIEEFHAIARRWGKWTRDVERFAHALEQSQQGDMFEAGDGWSMEAPPRAADVTPVAAE